MHYAHLLVALAVAASAAPANPEKRGGLYGPKNPALWGLADENAVEDKKTREILYGPKNPALWGLADENAEEKKKRNSLYIKGAALWAIDDEEAEEK